MRLFEAGQVWRTVCRRTGRYRFVRIEMVRSSAGYLLVREVSAKGKAARGRTASGLSRGDAIRIYPSGGELPGYSLVEDGT